MSGSHAAPSTTITTGDVLSESHGLMLQHREEAQLLYKRERRAGASKQEALASVGQLVRAAHRALIMHRAEMAHRAA